MLKFGSQKSEASHQYPNAAHTFFTVNKKILKVTGIVFFLCNEYKLVKFALNVILHAMDRSSGSVIFHQSGM